MNIKFKINRRHNVYITLFACAVGLWMMVTRFGLPVSELIAFTVITFVLLFGIVLVAAIIAYLIRKISDKKD